MISIIVPIYNVEEYISDCLKSIINQSFKDFECLLIDDGSSDRSIEIIKEIIGDDSRFKIYQNEHLGPSAARNSGLRYAKGEYIFFIDSDDFIREDSLELIEKHIDKYKSDVSIFDMAYYYNEDKIIYSDPLDFEVTSYKENRDIIFNNNSCSNKVFKRELLKDESFIEGMWYEDLAIVPIWLAKAESISYLNECLYFYRQREGSISYSENMHLFDVYKAIDNLKNRLNYTNEDLAFQYLFDGLLMSTFKIATFKEKDVRLKYYRINVDKLEKDFPTWYSYIKDVSFKRRIIYLLLKFRAFRILDMILK